MRRFILAALSAAALIVFLSPDAPETLPKPDEPVAAPVAELPAAEPSSSHARTVPPARPVGVAAPQAVAVPAEPALAEQNRGRGNRREIAYETTSPSHIPASVKAGGIDLDRLDYRVADADLTTTAQRELARLGCYGAKVDGVWGRQSRAAADRFSDRANGAWTPEPSRGLIAALRSAPNGFCTERCAHGQCALAQAAPAATPPAESDDASYLPPWMRGESSANAEPEGTLSDAPPAIFNPGPSERKVYSRAQRRDAPERRATERTQRSRSRNWAPEGWPGTGR